MIVNGYGIICDDIETNQESVEQLLKTAPRFEEKYREFYEQDCDYTPCLIGMILKEIIKERENIDLYVEQDEEDYTYLVFSPSFPWEMTEAEQKLTPEKLKEILRSYTEQLADDFVPFGYFTIDTGDKL